MNLDQLMDRLKADASFMDCVTEWRTLPPSEGVYAPLPENMDSRLKEIGTIAEDRILGKVIISL